MEGHSHKTLTWLLPSHTSGRAIARTAVSSILIAATLPAQVHWKLRKAAVQRPGERAAAGGSRAAGLRAGKRLPGPSQGKRGGSFCLAPQPPVRPGSGPRHLYLHEQD